jgi:AcrR family transcriptional regulator
MNIAQTIMAGSGQRGPVDHSIREQIISAADEHFKHYGYNKTSVSDLAKAIGFSKSYIYKFFDSKQAIGQAICTNALRPIPEAVRLQTVGARDSAEKLRLFFRAITDASAKLCFDEKHLFEIAEISSRERWPSFLKHVDTMNGILREILSEGRAAGEFERKTPLDELTRAIMQAMQPFMHPLMLRENLSLLPQGPVEVTALILRSLSP